MADETKITVEFGAEGETTAPKTELSSHTYNTQVNTSGLLKTVGVGLVLQPLSRELSVQGQLSGNYIQQNNINASMNIASNVYGIGMAFVANPVLGAISLASRAIGAIQDNRNIQIAYDKAEKANNNMRQLVGLEATNYSRYSGKRR